MLAVFDQPDMMSSCAARGQTVHALQALTLVNSQFMRRQSYLVAKRMINESYPQMAQMSADKRKSIRVVKRLVGENDNQRWRSDQIQRLFLLTLGRPPPDSEQRATTKFLAEQTALIRSRIARKEAVAVPPECPPGTDVASYLALSDLCLATLNLNEFIYLR